ncbi:MAG: CapA family protein [Ruminococcaceae bacterium]|nr:CapA family protein [Oscillospiraceae bacterium]
MKKTISFICLLTAILLLSSCGLFRPAGKWTESAETNKEPQTSEQLGTVGSVQITTEDKQPPQPAATPAKVSFVGCGDNIIYYGNVREAATKAPAGRQYGFAYSYDKVAHVISGADVAFINQETLMCGEGYDLSYYPTFNSPRDVGYDLVDVGFDVINIANNHMLDKTGSGLERTIEFWKSQPVLMIGGYESEEDFNTLRYMEKNGLKIAFLSYTYGTNGFVIGDSYNAWVPYLSEDDIKAQTEAAKAESDVVIVSVHWGEEGAFAPSEEQKKYAKLFADMGVDVIVGHHPHVIQPVEWIAGEGGGKTLCVYSLGNFMAEQAYDYNMVGGMISFDICRSEYGDISIENVLFIPTVFHHNASFYNNQVWLMEEYTAELASSHGISYYGNHTSLERLQKYVTDTVSTEFLPDFLK